MDAFERFLQERDKDLKRIARATRGECQHGDVASEAWLLAQRLADKLGAPPNFGDKSFQDMLIAHLYQALVRYTELNVRHAVRLDHALSFDGDADEPHPLMRRLSSGEEHDPLFQLLAHESGAPARDVEPPPTLAGAWVALLRLCDNCMPRVARRLLISTSYAYRCCAKARESAKMQNAMPLETRMPEPQVGPWRRHRMIRIPRQLSFDFAESLFAADLPTREVAVRSSPSAIAEIAPPVPA